MRLVLGLVAAFGFAAGSLFGGPAAAAVAVEADAPPDQLGRCAIALARWNALTEAQGGAPQAEYVQRLDAIMSKSHGLTDADPWNKAMTAAMVDQVRVYDSMTGEAQVKAMQQDLLNCEPYFDADTRPAGSTYSGPFLAGPGYKISSATPPSYAGYCYLAFDSLIAVQADRWGSDPMVVGARQGFNGIIGGMGDGYRNVAVESANNRGVFYRDYRRSHTSDEFSQLVLADANNCGKWIVAR